MKADTYIIHEADKCVKCGLCLPHCPTYRVLQNEGDSPRGRITLMQDLAHGRLRGNHHLASHLDGCLACRACEKVCPSGVQYGRLLDQSRKLLETGRKRGVLSARLRRFSLALFERPGRLARLYRYLRYLQRSGLLSAVRRSGLPILGYAAGLLPDGKLQPALSLKTVYPAVGLQMGVVALFTGCLGPFLEQAAIRSAIQLLTRLGYTVYIPAEQQCCGAIHQHGGSPSTALHMARHNADVFNVYHPYRPDALLYLSSGCGAMLEEYKQMGASANFDCPVMDISQFVNRVNWPQGFTLAPLPTTVTLHTPCTQRNVTGSRRDTLQLLQRIPELTIKEPAPDCGCCGAAGSYMISEADTAVRVRDNTLHQLDVLETKTLVTSNIGCALFVAAGMREAGRPVEVVHPVTLLNRQLQVTSDK